MPFQDPKLFQFPHICVVEASAGSGKTYALSLRYVQLLINASLHLGDIPLKNILAITFSNKATMEMKARILDLLKKIALDRFSTPQEKERIVSSLGIDFVLAQPKALKAMDALILNYNFFQVQTIDSFVNAILSACALKLRLSASFRIRTDSSVYLAFSLDQLIDAAATDKDVRMAFNRFLHQYLFLENKTGWFPKKNILETFINFFGKINRTGREFVLGTSTSGACDVEKADILLKMKKLEDVWPKGAHKSFEKKFMEFLETPRKSFDFDELSDYWKRQEFPLTKTGEISSEASGLWGEIRAGLKSVAEKESRALMDPYIDMFTRALKYFRAFSSNEDVLFLDELNRQAHMLFEQEGMMVPELYYRLAMRLKHILIDEFQDTSPLQWENLYPMIEEVLSVDGSLFYVGDKKQAIYRFRGGDVELFDAALDHFRGTSLIRERLGKNYRSRKEIVAFANEVFSKDNLKAFLEKCKEDKKEDDGLSLLDDEAVFKIFDQARQESREDKEGGYVKLSILDIENKEARNVRVREEAILHVKELHKRYPYGALAFLTRDNDDVELLTEWFIEEGIPVESEKTLNIRNNGFIKELVSFLQFLNTPIDNLSFASFICGEIFLAAAELKKEDMHDFIFDFKKRKDQEKTIYLYREFRRKYPKIWEMFFEIFFKNVGFVPLYELTISIFKTFGCLKCFPDALGFFMRFLELIKEQETENSSLALFLDFFDKTEGEDLYVRVPLADAVKVLTIHKAKGLEFPVVVLPFFEMNIKVEPLVSRFEGDRLVLMRLNKKYRSYSEKIDLIYRQEYLKSFIDELNAIYVALTRAQEELYVFLPRDSKRNSYAIELFPINEESERGVRPQERAQSRITKEALLKELPAPAYVDWITFLSEKLEYEFEEPRLLKNRKKIIRGEIIHYLLSYVKDLSQQKKDVVLKEAFRDASMKFVSFGDLKQYETVLDDVLNDKTFKPFFFVKGSKVFTEQEIVDKQGNTRRIDRLIVSDDEVQVIDYKTSVEKSLVNQDQVKEYMELVGALYPDKKVTGVLLYLDSLEFERVS
jgi:ATP-dependent exoDNAse (exonuclease V) beta subunit